MERQSAAKLHRQKLMDERLIGNTFGNITILEFSKSIKSRKFYKVRCNRCDSISEMRSDRFTGIQLLKSCKFCRQDFAVKKSIKRSSKNTIINKLFYSYKRNAYSRGLEFNINITKFLQLIKSNCYYCNSEPIESKTARRSARGHYVFKHNGVDRVNNSIGYLDDNVVSCCSMCNMMKKSLNKEVFIEHCIEIANNAKGSTTIERALKYNETE